MLTKRGGTLRMPIVRRIAFLLAAVTSLTAYDHSALADTGPCRSIEYERAAYAICEVDLHKHTVRLYWNRSGLVIDACCFRPVSHLATGANLKAAAYSTN